MSERSTVIQRVIQLTCEIEQTYGFGKSYTFGSVKVGGYSQSEWELKERQDQRWLDTAREWTKTRNPLIAELQALVAEHRVEFTELADLVERQMWSATAVPERAWAEIRRVALAAADRKEATGVTGILGHSDGERRENRDPSPIPKRPAWDRLTLRRSSDGSDHSADLDGKSFRIRGDAAFKMLEVLQQKKGERVKAAVLQIEINQRPDRVLKLLDKRLQRIIDPPKKGVGYAML